MIKLREYQEKAIDNIKFAFAKGKNRVILCSPTGSGKTVIFSKIIQLTNLKGNKVLIATDRKELLTQTGNALEKFNVDFGILNAKVRKIPKNITVVCMLETLKVRLKKQNYKDFVNNFDLIILDECHKNSFNRLFESLSETQRVIGASATPYRTGKMPELNLFYDEIIDVIQIPELIDLGFLSRPKSYGVTQDLSGIKMKMGDYDQKMLSDFYDNSTIYSGIYQNYIKFAENKKTLIFCVSISNSLRVKNDLENKGLNIKHLDSTMSELERSETLNWFENTDNAILSNVGILTTGFDCPSVECIILYRATKSLPLFLQMVGRGSRITETKKTFTILDFGNNILTHGFWEEKRLWSLKNAKKGKKKGDAVAPVKNCPNCEALIPTSTKICEICGYEYPEKEKSEVEVILSVLTPSEVQRYADICTVLELEEIRKIKEYKVGWILHRLKNYNEFLEYERIKGYKSGWAAFNYQRYKK